MVLLNLSAGRQQIQDEQRRLGIGWRAAMGLSPDSEIELADRPVFQEVTLKPLSEYVANLKEPPTLRSMELSVDAYGRLAAAENQRTLPGFDVSAGVKPIGSESGTLLGFSVTRPLLNTNRAAVSSLRAQEQVARFEAAISKSRVELKIKSLVESISELSAMLGPVSAGFAENRQAMADILLSYEEGFTSLSELLNSAQIEIAGSMSYYEQLRKYYAQLFELGVLTGDEIIRLGS